MKKKLFSISLLLLFIPSIFIGCVKKLDYSEISSYSDEVLSTVLTALSNNDYNTFSKHYNFAIYNTKFSDEEEEIRVSVAFKEEDENHKVYELYLSSDKLEKANSTN